MIRCKLCDLCTVLDRNANLDFIVNSYNHSCHFNGCLFDFLKSYLYQVYSTDYISNIEIIGDVISKKTLRIFIDSFD